jgi:hypothetical protein
MQTDAADIIVRRAGDDDELDLEIGRGHAQHAVPHAPATSHNIGAAQRSAIFA